MLSFKEFLAEGRFNPEAEASDFLKKRGIPHEIKKGAKHKFLHYTINGREFKYAMSHGKRPESLRKGSEASLKKHLRANGWAGE